MSNNLEGTNLEPLNPKELNALKSMYIYHYLSKLHGDKYHIPIDGYIMSQLIKKAYVTELVIDDYKPVYRHYDLTDAGFEFAQKKFGLIVNLEWEHSHIDPVDGNVNFSIELLRSHYRALSLGFMDFDESVKHQIAYRLYRDNVEKYFYDRRN